MPIEVKDSGPFQAGKDGKPFYIRKIVDKRYWKVVWSDSPTRIQKDLEPPECWERLEFACRNVQFEEYRIQIYEAVEKSKSFWWWIGAVLAVVGVVALVIVTGGTVAVILGGLKISAATLIGAGVVSAGAIGAGAGLMRLDPDKYEMGELLKEEPHKEEINARPYPPRVEYKRIPCPGEKTEEEEEEEDTE